MKISIRAKLVYLTVFSSLLALLLLLGTSHSASAASVKTSAPTKAAMSQQGWDVPGMSSYERTYSRPYSYGGYSHPYSYGGYSRPYSYGGYSRPYSYGGMYGGQSRPYSYGGYSHPYSYGGMHGGMR